MALTTTQRDALLNLIEQGDPKAAADFLRDGADWVQGSASSKIAITYTLNDPSITTDGAITVADGTTPTVAELLEFCEELNDQIDALRTALENFGVIAT